MEGDPPSDAQGPAPRTVFSRPMVWFLTALAAVFDWVLWLPLAEGFDPVQAVALVTCVVITFGLMLTAIDADRFPWAMRLVTGALFLVLFTHFIRQALGPRPNHHDILLAAAAVCLVGLPALAHTLWGSIHGPPDEDAPAAVVPGDLVTHVLLALTTLGGLAVLGMLAADSLATLWQLAGG
jgi:hypothetical protein